MLESFRQDKNYRNHYMKDISLSKSSKSLLWWGLYYVFLALLLLSWNDELNLPPMAYRYAFTALVIAPLYITRSIYFPTILIFFVILSAERHAVSYMMFKPMYISVVAIINNFLFRNVRANSVPPNLFWALLALCTISDLMNNASFHDVTFILISIIIFSQYVVSDKHLHQVWKLSIIVLCLILSIDFHLNSKNFVQQMIVSGADYERMGWRDPNYFGCILSVGGLLAYFEILDKNKGFIVRVINSLILGSISIAIISMASRGAVLALGTGIVLFTMLSDTGFKAKIVVSALVVTFIFFLLDSGYFDLLEARLMADDGTGSGRTSIWQQKLNYFSNTDNPLFFLLGYGYEGGLQLGYGSNEVGFHNDFIAMLVEYGIVGFSLFVSLFIMLIKNVSNRIKVWSLTGALLVTCMTLEPLTGGKFFFWFFLLYIYYIGHNHE